MTCIIGMEYKGKVYIAGDSCANNGWTINSLVARKVFRQGEFLVGFSGSVRQLNLLQHHIHPRAQEEGESDEHYVVMGLVETVRQCFKDNGVSKVDNNQETTDGVMLVGFRGGLYFVGSMFDVARFERGIAAIGVGDDYAIGSLLTQRKTACAMERRGTGELTVPEPEVMLMRALDIAAQMSGAVMPPFYVEVI